MANVHSTSRAAIGSNPGLVKFHPVDNERFLIRDAKLRGAVTPPRTAVEEIFKPVKRLFRNWWTKNEQTGPRCTAFGTLTDLACTPITHPGKNPLTNPMQFYDEIVAYDRSQGRRFSEGATTDAAMHAARNRGFISGWYWGYTLDTALRTLGGAAGTGKPIVAGTNWYDSMFDADAEGIIRITPNSPLAGGHLYCINGINPSRGLLRIAQTWGQGVQWIGFEDFLRLVREDGEFTLIDEVA